MTETTTPRRDAWHAIEGRQFGRCMWQQISKDRRVILEGLMHKGSDQIMIVEKRYEKPIPRNGRGSWPELASVAVYAPVAPDKNEWDAFERALGEIT